MPESRLPATERGWARGACTVAALLLAGLLAPALAAQDAPHGVTLALRPVEESFFVEAGAGADDAEVLRPKAGEWLLVLAFSDANFAITELSQLRLVSAESGRSIPLTIAESSLFEDFGEIVGLRLAARLPAESVDTWRLEWGEGIDAEHRLVRDFRCDPADAAVLRTATWSEVPADAAGGGDVSVASIEVIADRKADLYALWYLLPMLVIFVVLTLRKLRDGRSADAPAAGPVQ